MVFSSPTFLFYFLPIFMCVYFAVGKTSYKNMVLLLSSFLFYAWGEPVAIILLWFSILFNGIAAIIIDSQSGRTRTLCLAFAIIVNLSILGYFKYAMSALSGLAPAFKWLGVKIAVPYINLPLGISFFTFHCLSYVIDVYRRRFPANRRVTEVALYIALFPQLVAGPIVRYKTVAKQLRSRRHTFGRASWGLRIFVIGLAQKVLIADQVARLADVVFDRTPHPTAAEAWTGLLAYTIQIYFDFAGYSSMAVGLGLILGFTFPRNFRLPYTSLSITEFWRRWHMSLSAWLRDYLYIPLGGSRRGAIATYRNLLTVFTICGLWHGANWTFVLWGIWHGAFLIIERLDLTRVLSRLPTPVRWAYSIVVVMLGWILFRATDFQRIKQLFGGLVGRFGFLDVHYSVRVEMMPGNLVILALGCALAVLPRWIAIQRPATTSVGVLVDSGFMLGLLVCSMVYVAASSYSPFLYFRF